MKQTDKNSWEKQILDILNNLMDISMDEALRAEAETLRNPVIVLLPAREEAEDKLSTLLQTARKEERELVVREMEKTINEMSEDGEIPYFIINEKLQSLLK